MEQSYPEVVETRAVLEAYRMARSVMKSRDAGAVGAIVGEPGVGKTAIGHALVAKRNAVRICAYAGISPRLLVASLYEGLGLPPMNGGGATLVSKMGDAVRGRLIVIDECNALGWRELELLRYVSDEQGAGIIFIGTPIFDRVFRDARTAILLAQFASRIGGKRITVSPFIKADETAAYIIAPNFGTVSATVAHRFHLASGGYWRDGRALAESCKRIMSVQGASKLTREIVETAAAKMRTRAAIATVPAGGAE